MKIWCIFQTDHKSFVKSQRPKNPLHPLFNGFRFGQHRATPLSIRTLAEVQLMSSPFLLPSDELHNEWKGSSIRNTPRLNILPSACPPHSPFSLWSALFYSWVQAEFNKYMQMCAAEHDEFKSVCAALWALVRLRLRADPGLIIFHFPIAFNSAAAASVRACVCVCSGVRVCLGVGLSEWVHICVCLCVYY